MGYDAENNQWVGWIYLIENQLNQKKYVGQTRKIKPIYRFNEHASLSSRSKSLIDIAMRKYGKDNFSFEILEEHVCDTEEELCMILNTQEEKYIAQYNTFKGRGYNCTSGGLEYVAESYLVDQYDLEGVLLNTFDSANVAASACNCSVSQIYSVCNGNDRSAKGFIFRKHGDPFDLYPTEDQHYKPIKQFLIDGTFVKQYKSMTEAAVELNSSLSNISSACNGHLHCLQDKYVLRYIDDDFDKYSIEYNDNYRFKKPVTVYDYAKKIVAQYDSITSTATAFNTTPITILEACQGKTMTIKGKVCRFSGDPFDKYPVKFRTCLQYDKDYNLIAEYESQSEASRKTGFSLSSIQKCCAGKQETTHGYYFINAGNKILRKGGNREKN